MAQLNLPISQDEPDIDFATLDLLPYGIIVVDEVGTILYYNAREEQIAGRRRAEVLGRNFFSEIAPCTQVQEFYGRFRETMHRAGLVAAFHFPFPARPREVEITLTSFQKDGSNLCLISVSDVTEKDVLRERLVRGERLREVGEVAAGVAHNFNNILTVIRGNAELLLTLLPEGDFAHQRAEKILQAAEDGEQMVRRIGESTRRHHRPETVSALARVALNGLVKDSIAFTEDYASATRDERGAHARFRTELAQDVPPVLATPSELREVFVNLLRNAVDAIEGEGEVVVRTRAEGPHGLVEVSDTGTGMSPEVMEKLFRPLFSTKGERGTGLGLATAYAIVRRHGGDIQVKSAPGEGTTFTVRLPLAAE